MLVDRHLVERAAEVLVESRGVATELQRIAGCAHRDRRAGGVGEGAVDVDALGAAVVRADDVVPAAGRHRGGVDSRTAPGAVGPAEPHAVTPGTGRLEG